MRNHLEALRLERGWSQGVLADHLGVSHQTVDALETGRDDPALPLASGIARLFACRIEDVFVPDEQGGPEEPLPAAQSPSSRTPA